MFKNFDEARQFVEREQIQMVDIKFCDLWGRWHHLTIPASQFTPDLMEKGIGFDGSSVGLKSVKSGDIQIGGHHTYFVTDGCHGTAVSQKFLTSSAAFSPPFASLSRMKMW